MSMTSIVLEHVLVEALSGGLPRSPLQRNRPGESDAELICLPGMDRLLAVTVDGLVEEIETGLYSDLYLIGWMTVVTSASDLAAVGADPLGILLSQTLPPDLTAAARARLQQGVSDACSACGLPVLGGDTNHAARLHMESVALGTVPTEEAMRRTGCRPGDRIFLSGPAGAGSAYAFEALTRPGADPDVPFLPAGRVREGRLLRRFASCCIDTSDGVLPALDELMRRSDVGIKLGEPVSAMLDPAARRITAVAGLPAWTLLAGPHGEFELAFAVPAERCSSFLDEAAGAGWHPLWIGEARVLPGLELGPDDGCIALDTGAIRNLAGEAAVDVDRYIGELLRVAGEAYRGA